MRLPRVVVALGLVSLLTDIGSEMVYPLLPALLVGFGAGAISLGAVEGVGDATAAILKLVSGRLSDRVGRRKPLVLAGYGLSSLVRPLVAFAVSPWQVVLVRFVDRIGKGIRTSPRDALLAASVPSARSGAAFGFHRAMDNVGATVGPALVALGLFLTSGDVRKVLLFTIIPGALAVLVIVFGVRGEQPVPSRPEGAPPTSSPEKPPAALRSYVAILGFFAIVNTSDLFLLRRLVELGASTSTVALSWSALNGIRALAGYPGGAMADRFGRSRSMMLGWAVYAASYAAMALATSKTSFLVGLVAYGFFYGLTEGAERALVASLVKRDVLGRTFGTFHLVTGLASLPSNLLFGWAWDAIGGRLCLLVSGAGALLALAALAVWSDRFGAGGRRPA